MNLLTVNGLSAGYDGKNVIKEICFSMESGKITGLLGANGCGKTTLIKAVANLIPHQGSCCMEGQDTKFLSSRQFAALCGYIPQRSGISIDLTLLDVVLMGFNPDLKFFQQPSSQMKKEALRALSMVGLAHRKNDNFQHLSEGQKQLVLLARTFAGKRKLLLLDEPESALDFRLRYQVMELLHEHVRKNQSSALVTLHDSSLALNYCDTLLVLSDSRLSGILEPAVTPVRKLELLLSEVYGPVSITVLSNRSGKRWLTMMKEDVIS